MALIQVNPFMHLVHMIAVGCVRLKFFLGASMDKIRSTFVGVCGGHG